MPNTYRFRLTKVEDRHVDMYRQYLDRLRVNRHQAGLPADALKSIPPGCTLHILKPCPQPATFHTRQ